MKGFFRTKTSQYPNSLPASLHLQCQDLIEIRSKREKEREEEKKKGSSFLLGNLVQIPMDLYEGVRTVIFFFEIKKKRCRSKAEERDLQGASTSMISVLQSGIFV